MRFGDLLKLALEALGAHRLRYGLSALAIAVGVAAVVMLASIGEGTRLFIMKQMMQFGTTLIAVNPGKTETGGVPGMLASQKKLTVDDARALSRLPGVTGTAPLTYGSAAVKFGSRSRRCYVYGTTWEASRVWSMPVAAGQFLPEMDFDRGAAVIVLGPKLKRELFGDANALGEAVRVAESRFRVIGVMEAKGQMLGFDLDDAAYIPLANAIRIFNRPELDEIDLQAANDREIDPVAERIRATLTSRHDGHEDFSITTQKEAQETVGNILAVVSGVVTAIAGISLVVGAIGILTIMWIVVNERVNEIGLVKALGARRNQILLWYLFEAAFTAVLGSVVGLVAGLGAAWLLSAVIPGLSVSVAPSIVIAAVVMALVVGLAAGVAPARRAAGMDPVEALRAE